MRIKLRRKPLEEEKHPTHGSQREQSASTPTTQRKLERQTGLQITKMPSAAWFYCIQEEKIVVYILHK